MPNYKTFFLKTSTKDSETPEGFDGYLNIYMLLNFMLMIENKDLLYQQIEMNGVLSVKIF